MSKSKNESATILTITIFVFINWGFGVLGFWGDGIALD